MPALDVVRFGSDRLRVGPWRGDDRLAYVAPAPDRPPPSQDGVRHCLALLAGQGFRGAVTGALSVGQVRGFLEAGFEVRERLHLLVRGLHSLPAETDGPLRRARRTDRPGVLAVDTLAFPPFWRLDDSGLTDALTATPSTRFRVATPGPAIVGYAVAGRAGIRGYLQRLAVDPAHQGQGIGTALALDGLHWMRRRRCHQALVNTQEGNDAALALYERLGFHRQPGGLAVLEAVL